MKTFDFFGQKKQLPCFSRCFHMESPLYQGEITINLSWTCKTAPPGPMDWASPVWSTVQVSGSTQTSLLYIGEKLAWGGSMAVTVVVSVTCDRWQVTGDTWQVTHDSWHMRHNFLSLVPIFSCVDINFCLGNPAYCAECWSWQGSAMRSTSTPSNLLDETFCNLS